MLTFGGKTMLPNFYYHEDLHGTWTLYDTIISNTSNTRWEDLKIMDLLLGGVEHSGGQVIMRIDRNAHSET